MGKPGNSNVVSAPLNNRSTTVNMTVKNSPAGVPVTVKRTHKEIEREVDDALYDYRSASRAVDKAMYASVSRNRDDTQEEKDRWEALLNDAQKKLDKAAKVIQDNFEKGQKIELQGNKSAGYRGIGRGTFDRVGKNGSKISVWYTGEDGDRHIIPVADMMWISFA